MEVTKSTINDVLILTPRVFKDNRGWFYESYTQKALSSIGIEHCFVQANHSFSLMKNTVRGLHFQNNLKAQTKIVRCTVGSIMDVAVDLRKNSLTYLQWVMVELSAGNKKQLYIPKGFAHGFLSLTDNVEIQYLVDEFYSPEADRSIRYDDPDIGIRWNVENPILSEKDSEAPLLKDSDYNF